MSEKKYTSLLKGEFRLVVEYLAESDKINVFYDGKRFVSLSTPNGLKVIDIKDPSRIITAKPQLNNFPFDGVTQKGNSEFKSEFDYVAEAIKNLVNEPAAKQITNKMLKDEKISYDKLIADVFKNLKEPSKLDRLRNLKGSLPLEISVDLFDKLDAKVKDMTLQSSALLIYTTMGFKIVDKVEDKSVVVLQREENLKNGKEIHRVKLPLDARYNMTESLTDLKETMKKHLNGLSYVDLLSVHELPDLVKSIDPNGDSADITLNLLKIVPKMCNLAVKTNEQRKEMFLDAISHNAGYVLDNFKNGQVAFSYFNQLNNYFFTGKHTELPQSLVSLIESNNLYNKILNDHKEDPYLKK